MADFICLAMVPQYTTEQQQQQQQNGSENNNNSSSFRRSLNSNLFGRRSTSNRNSNNNNTVIEQQPFVQQQAALESVHVRIVPHIDNPSRSLVFSIIERDLEAGHVVRVGRFTDRIATQNHISFKSKVVSRTHCELWLSNDGKVLIKDTKSSSGTFINHSRLSPTNQESRAVEIRDGDIVQLGVDYQGGLEEIYRAVKMKFEINRPQQQRPISYSMSAYNNLRNLTSLAQHHSRMGDEIIIKDEDKDGYDDNEGEAEYNSNNDMKKNKNHVTSCHSNEIEVEECCICLYALAPFQALFVAPCSHSYHFKCIRPLFDSYPGFQCPICRTYSDLDASVAIETEEVIEKFGLSKVNTAAQSSTSNKKAATNTKVMPQSRQSNQIEEQTAGSSNSLTHSNSQRRQHQHHHSLSLSSSGSSSSEAPLSRTLISCTTTNFTGSHSKEVSSTQSGSQDQSNNAGDHRATIIFEDSNNNVMVNQYLQNNSIEEEELANDVDEEDGEPIAVTATRTNSGSIRRVNHNNSGGNFVEKIKLAFSPERRKSSSMHKKYNSSSELDRSETMFDMPSTSSPPCSPRVRNSLHLNEIIEEGTVIQRDRL